MDATFDLGNFSNNILKELVKSAFVKGIKFCADNEMVFYYKNGKKRCISKRNYGAKQDADTCTGSNSRGNYSTFDEIQNLDFDIMSRDDFEYLSSHGHWYAFSNSGEYNNGFNRRACLKYNDSYINFYGSNFSSGFIRQADIELKDILKENNIDSEEYIGYTWACNWLSGPTTQNKAYMVAIPMEISPTPETKKGFSQEHTIKKPLILKADKSIELPCHIVINLE